ncbi:phage protease [Pseudomonas qingdaonensis]|nr:phage protease [Pseudomonas qingdaonensis]
MKTLLALNTDLSALPSTEGRAPEWIELIPAGPTITGRDGRTWLFDELAQQLVLAAFTSRAIDMVIDWEHASEVSAPQGEAAPAAGWIDRLEIRANALWGHVAWTPRAGEQVAARSTASFPRFRLRRRLSASPAHGQRRPDQQTEPGSYRPQP